MSGLGVAVAVSAIPVACVGYGLIEARLYRRIDYTVPILPEGSNSIRILQVSDLHLRRGMRRLQAFVRSMAGEPFDLVLATGDLLGEPEAVEPCLEILDHLAGRSGRYFVFGSADYYAPKFRNYFDYFLGRRHIGTRLNRTDEFRSGLLAQGWTDLTNITLFADINGTRTQITGLDDPYLKREDRTLLVTDASVDLALCVVHDPSVYLDAARAGFDLVAGGHTHGGQVRFPWVGALVTNSDLPRRLARGLHRIEGTWLFVNPGLGTSKYAPFRFLCPPEASVLHLVAKA